MFDFFRRIIRRRKAAVHFTSDNIVIKEYKLNLVHQIPENIKENDEIDFYLDSGYDIYILRLVNNKNRLITISPAGKTFDMIYITAEVQFNKNTILYDLENTLNILKNIGLPKIKNPRREVIISF